MTSEGRRFAIDQELGGVDGRDVWTEEVRGQVLTLSVDYRHLGRVLAHRGRRPAGQPEACGGSRPR